MIKPLETFQTKGEEATAKIETFLGTMGEATLTGNMRNFIAEAYEAKNMSHAEVIHGICELLKAAAIIDSHNVFETQEADTRRFMTINL
jgi:hypothetical protein